MTFALLVAYAQHDPRYLRAVSRTSRKLRDPNVENHNLPMVLLLREALRIKGGDKKKAVGLLDEAIRIPYAWIKSIPREALPGSLALDNFLLPGNKEDGADKSRHWNVFGGICLYKSPQEALDLALKREMQDLRDDHYSEEAMREFFRDMIANLNGMYHVMTVNPDLLADQAPPLLEAAAGLVDVVTPDEELATEALGLALTAGRTAYDMPHAVLARRHACAVLTMDSKLARVLCSLDIPTLCGGSQP